MCLDPKVMNIVLLMEHYLLPLFEEVTAWMDAGRVLTLFDVCHRFWHYICSGCSIVLPPHIQHSIRRIQIHLHAI